MEQFSPLSQRPLPIEIIQGETFILPVTYLDDSGSVIDLTNYTAVLTVKKSNTSSGDPIIELTTENGLIVITGDEGYIQCTIPAGTTAGLEAQDAVYDLFVKSPNDVSERILFGPARITQTSQEAN